MDNDQIMHDVRRHLQADYAAQVKADYADKRWQRAEGPFSLRDNQDARRAALEQQLTRDGSSLSQLYHDMQNAFPFREHLSRPRKQRSLAEQIAWLRKKHIYRGDAHCLHRYTNSAGELTHPGVMK